VTAPFGGTLRDVENVYSAGVWTGWSAPIMVVAATVVAWMVTRVSGVVLRRVVRRLADRAVRAQAGPWRVRSRRRGEESNALHEQRRRQRVDAAARMINHLVSVVVWLIALIVVFHLLEVDAAFFLSSAGFIGAGVAIGGQHKVNDYLTGLLVHFEDRYGVGDLIEWETPSGGMVRGVVENVGLFTTRVREGDSSVHIPNHALAHVRNRSQEAAATTLHLRVGSRVDEAAVTSALRDLAGEPGLTDVLFVGDIASHQPDTGEIRVDVMTPRPLDSRLRERLERRAERRLGAQAADDDRPLV